MLLWLVASAVGVFMLAECVSESRSDVDDYDLSDR